MSVPSGNPGAVANAKSQLREAAKIVEKVLPMLQHGTEDYRGALSILQTLAKIAPPSAEVPGVQATTAAGLNADAQKSAAMGMLAPAGASAGGGGAGAPAGPPSPAMPPSLAA